MELPKRKNVRLKEFDYSTAGGYFITLCVKDKRRMLGEIVGGDALIAPKNRLSEYGEVCRKYLENINAVYNNAKVDKYVIMPNHIHLIISIDGSMRASTPTMTISSMIRSFKTLVTKEIGENIWQRSFYDHIIRGDEDFKGIWEYIESNPINWEKDEFYE